MMTSARSRSPRFAAAGVFALLAVALATAAALEQRRSTTSFDRSALPVLRYDTVEVPAALSIVDFTGDPARLFLLDGRAHQIVTLMRLNGRWSVRRRFGKEGDGPGELRIPNGIALHGARLIVTDGERLHVYDTLGTHLSTTVPNLPCHGASMLPVSNGNELLLSLNCRTGQRGDTVAAVLYRSADLIDFTLAASAPRFAIDGDWGSYFYAQRAVTEIEGGVLFGIGRDRCVLLIQPSGMKPDRVCGELTPFRAPAPRSFAATGRGRSSAATKWPDPLPYYLDRVQLAGQPAVWRPFAADSIVLTTLAAQSREIAVAGLDNFLGCHAAGCAWVLERETGTAMLLVPHSHLASLVTRQ